MASKDIGFWEGILHPERKRVELYKEEQAYMSPYEKLMAREYLRSNPGADFTGVEGYEDVQKDYESRQAKRNGPLTGMMDDDEGKSNVVMGKTGFVSKEVKGKKKEADLVKKNREIVSMAMKLKKESGDEEGSYKDYMPEAESILYQTGSYEAFKKREEDKRLLGYRPELENVNPNMPNAGVEGAPMPPMPTIADGLMPGIETGVSAGLGGPQMPGVTPTQEQIMQPQQNIQLPEEITTSGQALKFLTQQGMPEEEAKAYIRSQL